MKSIDRLISAVSRNDWESPSKSNRAHVGTRVNIKNMNMHKTMAPKPAVRIAKRRRTPGQRYRGASREPQGTYRWHRDRGCGAVASICGMAICCSTSSLFSCWCCWEKGEKPHRRWRRLHLPTTSETASTIPLLPLLLLMLLLMKQLLLLMRLSPRLQ